MSTISSLSRVISGLRTSEQALNTTAHNLANVNTKGYVRQQVLIKESGYLNIGHNATSAMSVGMGTDIQSIRQVRDMFLDQSFRQEQGRYGFYNSQFNAIEEIETIFGETENESFAKVINDVWESINELAKNPSGLETRGAFVQNTVLFVNRANLIMDQLNDYQYNLNENVVDMVDRINNIGEQIHNLNDMIVKQELSGGTANDYRDQRNTLVDELSELVNISYREDKSGNLIVRVENVDFVTADNYNKMGLTEAESLSPLVVPVWEHLGGTKVYNLDMPTSPQYNNDIGALKGLIMARGSRNANYTDVDLATYEIEVKPYTIMNAQAQFDKLIHGIVTMINDLVSPNNQTAVGPPPVFELDGANAPYGLDGSQGIEIFKRKYVDRYTGTVYNQEDSSNINTLYSASNIEINQEVLMDYDKICISSTVDDVSDTTVVDNMLKKWKEPFSSIEPGLSSQLNFNEYYNEYISGIGNIGSYASNQMSNQELMTMQIDNKRNSFMAVSSDEELSNMIKYQHAYNAAAKVISVLDTMIEQVVMSTGIVGR